MEGQNNITEISTLKEMLKLNAQRYSLRKAFLYKDENGEAAHISYRRFSRHVNRLGTALNETLKLQGAKIAICGKNSYRWCVAYFAACGAQGMAVPLERDMIFEEMNNIFRFADIKAVIADAKVCKRLLENYDELPEDFIIIGTDFDGDERVVSFDRLMKDGQELINNGCETFVNAKVDPDAPAVLLFTSGTTGMAKGVMLSNRNICSDLMSTCGRVDLSYDDSTLCILPLHHAYQSIVMLMLIYIGGSVCFCEGLRHISDDLSFFKPTVFVSVPLILEKMHGKIVKKLSEQSGLKKALTVGKVSALFSRISNGEVKKRIYSLVHEAFGGRLRVIIVGGAMMNPDVARDYAAFGFPVIIGYGLTECSPIVICNSSDSPLPDCIGKPVDGASAVINEPDEDGIGEILVSGPMVMHGYYNDPEETAKVLKEGWLHTGDLGFIDDDGNFHITGRSKNVIIAKNGKNVYPEELEYYLNNDPLVLESLIFADSADDEIVTAEVVPDEEAIKDELQKEKLTKSDIQQAITAVIKRINKRLPSYKNIRRINIHDGEFEKTSTQKVKRFQRSAKKNAPESGQDPQDNGGDDSSD